FLPSAHHEKPIVREFDWRGSVKDMVESLNVPHPEVALLTVNAEAVGFDYIVVDGDVIEAYPVDRLPDGSEAAAVLRPPLTDKPRFILDTHLGRLAAYLRMAGFDTLYRNDYPDDELAQVAHDERRVLLTRDIGLLKRGLVTYGYFVRETNPAKRLHEIVDRFDLSAHTDGVGFARCTRCNGTLHPATPDEVRGRVRDTTLDYYDTFHVCEDCEQVYWAGSHYQRMAGLLADALGRDPA
ncbi:MAG: Mut7-C RNAse domain-containing protein, partial [Chloroflexota bacterium]